MIVKDYEKLRCIVTEFNKRFAFKNNKVEFKMPLASIQNFVERPKMVPIGTPFCWNFPYYRLEGGAIYLCKTSQFNVSGNHEKINFQEIMSDIEYEKFVEGTKFYEENYRD